MRLKKSLTMVLFFVLFIMILSACGESDNENASEDYPEEEIEIIVPFDAGGAADVSARLLAKHAEDYLDGDIVIENNAGGGGTVGQQAVATADSDGYTLLLATNSVITNPLFNDVNYDTEDFSPIAQTVSDIFYLYIPKNDDYDDIESFIEYAEKNPGELTIATSGAQTIGHFAVQQLIDEADIDVELVPYDGGEKVASAVAGDHDSAGAMSFSEADAQVENGKVKPVLTFEDSPTDNYPDVPTSYDLGYEITADSWRGILAPDGLDEKIIEKLEKAFKQASEDDDYKEAMENQGLDVTFKNNSELKEIIEENYEEYKQQGE